MASPQFDANVTLQNGEESNAQWPDTFLIPSREDRDTLIVGETLTARLRSA